MSEIDKLYNHYSNGKLRSIAEMKDKQPHGKFTGYHENGKVRIESLNRDGEMHGECKVYRRDGSVLIHHFYRDGKNVTSELKDEFGNEITDEVKLLITLKWGLPCLK